MADLQIVFLVALIACTHIQFGSSQSEGTSSSDSPVTSPSSDRSFSIGQSNAPDPQFEWDAVQCLSEAYLYFPGNLDSVIKTFGELYKLKHFETWYVNAGCRAVYNPKDKITIVVNVNEPSGVTPIILYN